MLITTAAASRVVALSFLVKPSSPFLRRFSSSPYPLYYELIHHRPVRSHPPRHRRGSRLENPQPEPDADPESEPDMDRSKRKYYRKRAQRMFGGGGDSDSDSDSGRGGAHDSEFVELKPEVVDFPRLHAREQELYFHDAFAFPWEKDKHHRMVYQLEKKYFPDQSLDKAFVDPDAAAAADAEPPAVKKTKQTSKKESERDERALVFFDDGEKDEKRDVTETKVQEFFKCLKKVPSGGSGRGAVGRGRRKDVTVAETEEGGEPLLVSRRTELPPRWDGLYGTAVLVDKPKGQLLLIYTLVTLFADNIRKDIYKLDKLQGIRTLGPFVKAPFGKVTDTTTWREHI